MKKVMKSITLLVGTMALTAVAGLAQAETRFAVQDAAGTTDKMVVTDTGFVGVGVTAPVVAFHGKGNATASQFRAHYNGLTTNGGGTFVLLHNNGSNTLLPTAGDRIGALYFGTEALNPNNNLAGPYYGAGFTVKADGPWAFDPAVTTVPTPFFAPASLSFETGSSTSSKVERLKISSSGNIGIGLYNAGNPTQKLEVKGGVRILSSVAGAKPACDATVRGTIWVTQNSTSAADALEICLKEAGATPVYSWRAL